MEIIKTKSFELAVITRGDKKSDKLIVALPGRLDTKDYVCFPNHLEYFAGKGFYGVSFDPPGTWESPGGIELFTTTNYIKAVNEVIEYYGGKQTILLGHSRGGATAVFAGCANPAVVGIITINESLGTPSPPDPKRIRGDKYLDLRDFPPGTTKTSERKEFLMPLTYFEDGAKYNDAEVLKTCVKPKLIISSKRDEFNSPAEVKAAYEQASEPKMFHELDCSHDYRYYPEVVDEVNGVMGEFLEKVLKLFCTS